MGNSWTGVQIPAKGENHRSARAIPRFERTRALSRIPGALNTRQDYADTAMWRGASVIIGPLERVLRQFDVLMSWGSESAGGGRGLWCALFVRRQYRLECRRCVTRILGSFPIANLARPTWCFEMGDSYDVL